METLKKCQYAHFYELLPYEEMGHTSFPLPYVIPNRESLLVPMNGGIFTVGGTLKGNADGQYRQYHSWIKTLEFLKK